MMPLAVTDTRSTAPPAHNTPTFIRAWLSSQRHCIRHRITRCSFLDVGRPLEAYHYAAVLQHTYYPQGARIINSRIFDDAPKAVNAVVAGPPVLAKAGVVTSCSGAGALAQNFVVRVATSNRGATRAQTPCC